MKFSAKEDLEAPIAQVFRNLSDFGAYERAAMRLGADVTKGQAEDAPCVGMTWHVRAEIRGKMRDIDLELARYEAPHLMFYNLQSANLRGVFEVELVAMSKGRTRMRMSIDVRPKNLPTRLLLQSAKLARNTLNRRYKSRIRSFARDLEARCNR